MTAPNAESSEPTLQEAFGEFSEALVDSENASEGEAPEPEQAEPAKPAEAAAAPEAKAGDEKQPAPPVERAEQPARPAEQQQQQQQQPDAKEPERQPLTYTVNGQQRSFDGGFIVPGYGAVIANEALPKLQDRLQQADRLVEQNQRLYQATQEYQRLGGRGGFDKLTADKAMLDASATLLLRALTDEATLVTLATDPVARQQLVKEIHLTAREAAYNATTQARELVAREQAQGQTEWRTQTAIHNAVAQLAQEFSGLMEEDVQAVRQHASRMHTAIVRPATPAEAREANVQVGSPVIDLDLLNSLLQDRHALRTSALEQAKKRQTDALENAARAAAAAPTTVTNGRAAPSPRSGAGRQAAAPAKKTLDTMSSAELTRAMKSGRIFDLMGDDDEQ